jgi:hypothetical protein
MADTLDQDVTALKDWLSGAWRRLADMSLTSFDRGEIRHYMRDADIPLVPDLTGCPTVRQPGARRRLDFRFLKLDSR